MEELMEIEGRMQIREESQAHGVWMRAGARLRWHAVEAFKVYIYGTQGGGYDSIVSAMTMCSDAPVRIEESEMRTDRPPDGEICPRCYNAIEGAL